MKRFLATCRPQLTFEKFIDVPLPLQPRAHFLCPSMATFAAIIGLNLFHQNRTASWLTSMPRWCSRSSSFRSDNRKRTYIILEPDLKLVE